ncbi:MAG: Flp family type IVb pilin [Magnetospiraceae bacterium]
MSVKQRTDSLTQTFSRFFKNIDGANAIEYALIAAGIAVAILTAVGFLGEELITTFERINTVVVGARPT